MAGIKGQSWAADGDVRRHPGRLTITGLDYWLGADEEYPVALSRRSRTAYSLSPFWCRRRRLLGQPMWVCSAPSKHHSRRHCWSTQSDRLVFASVPTYPGRRFPMSSAPVPTVVRVDAHERERCRCYVGFGKCEPARPARWWCGAAAHCTTGACRSRRWSML